MRGDVHAPAVLARRRAAQRARPRPPLGGDGHRRAAAAASAARPPATSGGERVADSAPNIRRSSSGAPSAVVVVGQQRLVVALPGLGHALGVPARELHVALQRGREGREVILRARAAASSPGPSALARATSTASSSGTRRARSQSRRARRTTSAVELAELGAVETRRATRRSHRRVARSCIIRASEPSWSRPGRAALRRASSPAGPIRRASRPTPRSASSATRARRLLKGLHRASVCAGTVATRRDRLAGGGRRRLRAGAAE